MHADETDQQTLVSEVLRSVPGYSQYRHAVASGPLASRTVWVVADPTLPRDGTDCIQAVDLVGHAD